MTDPYYDQDGITVHAGDCLDVLRELPDASVDAVVTDPPYNLSFMAKPWDAYDGREDAGFAYWFTGLIDGEGHFAIKQHSRGTHAPYFQLKMRRDERGTLERIRRSLGVGTISEQAHEPNPMVQYAIQDRAGCQRLVDLLDKYPLRAKKQVDYWTWRDAVCEWTSRPRGNRWQGRADNTKMASLRGRLMENRAYTDIPWSGHEFQDWCRLWGAECLRVLKPGGHLLSFGGTRTWHRMTAGLEDAGFEIRDSIAWLYGSGFPKSLDVSKAIDKAAGAEREVVGQRIRLGDSKAYAHNPASQIYSTDNGAETGMRPPDTAPATDDARTWQGWGTALKPAHEPVVVARKPLGAGTVAANVLAHGTGALNIDACRVAGEPWKMKAAEKRGQSVMQHDGSKDAASRADIMFREHPERSGNPAGRWPANVILDEDQSAALDTMSGDRPASSRTARNDYDRGEIGASPARKSGDAMGHADTGGASRFFYTAKAAAAERVRLPKPVKWADRPHEIRENVNDASMCLCGLPIDDNHDRILARPHENPNQGETTAHPTVKPLALMRWLIRLVTPPGGIVLEPFAGSGTTVEACILEGFNCVAIEREPDYLPLIMQRIHRRRDPVQAVKGAGTDGGLFDLLDGEAAS